MINDLIEGIFHSKLICELNGSVYEIDSRTSDALALAVRFQCPIFTSEFILDRAGIILEGEEEKKVETNDKPRKAPSKIKSQTLKKLSTELDTAISKEDYELAARLRDEIEKLQKKK